MKMNKKIQKVLSVMMILIYLVAMFGTLSLATTSYADPSQYKGTDQQVEGLDKVQGLGNQIITVITTVGSILAVIVLVVLGIKYMMGSAEERADYKKTLMPYFIGALLIFAASAVAGIVYRIAGSVTAS